MTTITIDRSVVKQALEALEQCGLDDTHRSYEFEHAARAALRAALAQEQAEPDISRCPQCNCPADNGFDRSFPPSPYLCTKCMAEPLPGAWVASKDGRVIYDDASTDDGLLRVSGDFENDEQRIRYAQRIVDKLNAAPTRCPNCASLETQNAELDRKLAEMEQAEPVQMHPSQFAELIKGKETMIGVPVYWSEWPTKETQ